MTIRDRKPPSLTVLAVLLPLASAPVGPVGAAEPLASPRAERVANRIAERRYARMSIAEARMARAADRAAEIAALVPEPPPPRPVTVRRLARAGVPPGGFSVPAGAGSPPVSRPAAPAAVRPQPAATVPASPDANATASGRPETPSVDADAGAWTLAPDPAVQPAAAGPDGTRSVLTGGDVSAPPRPGVDRPGPAVTQPPVELLPTPPRK